MLEFRQVRLSRENRNLLSDLNLVVSDHQVLGVFGADPDSRSALIRMAAGSLKPDAGEVLLDEDSLCEGDGRSFERIGYLPEGEGVYPKLKVDEYYDLILSLYKIYGRNRWNRMRTVLKMLEIERYQDYYMEDLPPAIVPVVTLGAAILHDPDWLFVDSPFERLNVESRNQMTEILDRLHEMGMTIVLNTANDPGFLGFVTDVVMLEEGTNRISGPVENVLEIARSKSPVRMRVLSGMDAALAVLKKSPVVERVTVVDQDVIFRFSGDERQEAELLGQIVCAGALVKNYNRDRIPMEEFLRGHV